MCIVSKLFKFSLISLDCSVPSLIVINVYFTFSILNFNVYLYFYYFTLTESDHCILQRIFNFLDVPFTYTVDGKLLDCLVGLQLMRPQTDSDDCILLRSLKSYVYFYLCYFDLAFHYS